LERCIEYLFELGAPDSGYLALEFQTFTRFNNFLVENVYSIAVNGAHGQLHTYTVKPIKYMEHKWVQNSNTVFPTFQMVELDVQFPFSNVHYQFESRDMKLCLCTLYFLYSTVDNANAE
jgi:hypothetical protein